MKYAEVTEESRSDGTYESFDMIVKHDGCAHIKKNLKVALNYVRECYALGGKWWRQWRRQWRRRKRTS